MTKKLENVLKEISLKTMLLVDNEMAFINLLVELGYIKNKMWSDSEKDLLFKIRELAKKHTDTILEHIEGLKKNVKD